MEHEKISLKILLWWSAGLVALVGGCSQSRDPDVRAKALTGFLRPQAPVFFTGAACVLLTNFPGFSARVTVQTESIAERERNFTGQLLGRGSKLLFAPEPDEALAKQQRTAGLSFVWDAAENRGYVLSEAMQAYAPVSSSLQVTNVVISPVQVGPQKFSGHLCETAQAVMQKADGTTASFEVLRATDLNGFPVRITSGTNATAITLTFSKIRLEVPAAEIFETPNGFSKYSSPEALVDELASRQRNLKHKSYGETQPYTGYGSGH